MKVDSKQEIVAEDVWRYRKRGRERLARAFVLKPEPIPDDKNGDWRCGICIEGITEGVSFAMGVGPVDSLMNAARLLISIWDDLGGATPRAAPKPRKFDTKAAPRSARPSKREQRRS